MAEPPKKRSRWATIHRIWIAWGILVTIVFNAWMLLGRRAQGFDKGILESDARVAVASTPEWLSFTPAGTVESTGLVFFPGGMVDPRAYAPLAHSLALEGFETLIVKLPFRSAPFESQEKAVFERVRERITRDSERRWAVAGHSRGAALACRFAARHPSSLAALILMGTTHPKDHDLSQALFPVLKLYATNDGVAPLAGVEANKALLPAGTRWVRIEGGNHGQFGWYGKQLGDERATISREQQQEIVREAILGFLRELPPTGVSPDSRRGLR